MALTTYSGLSKVQPRLFTQTDPTTTTLKATTTAGSNQVSINNVNNSAILNDYYLLVVNGSGAAALSTISVSSIVPINTISGTWTRLLRNVVASTANNTIWTEIWFIKVTANSIPPSTINVNLSAAVPTGGTVTAILSQWSGASADPTLGFNQSSNTSSFNTFTNLTATTSQYTGTFTYFSGQTVDLMEAVPSSLYGPGFNSTTPQGGSYYTGFIEGINSTPQFGTYGATLSSGWEIYVVYFQNATIQLDDYNYLLRDDGVLLNGQTFPIYDVEAITGLNDTATNGRVEHNDGGHGSYVAAKFHTGKTIDIKGTIYSLLPVDESVVDNLKRSARASSLNDKGVPFYYKRPNKPLRSIYVKPLDLRSDEIPSRGYGKIPYEIIAQSEDPRSYSPLAGSSNHAAFQAAGGNATFAFSITPSGNIETYPKLYFKILSSGYSAGTQIQFINDTWAAVYGVPAIVTVDLGPSTPFNIAGGVNLFPLNLDMSAKRLTNLNTNADYSGNIITRNWWGFVPNQSNLIRMVITVTGGATSNGPAWGVWPAFGDAWL